MSPENVEVVRESFAAFNRGDLDAALHWMHPKIEWQTHEAFPDAATYHGRHEVREFWENWRGAFRGFQLHLEACVPAGERHVLATFRVSGHGAGSGVGVASPAVFQVGDIQEGQVIWVGMFATDREALDAARLRERGR